ncbi:MAG: CYTH domain-containing protein [Gammaproteobacteria bacterium]|jgi:adenylate cyclase
MATEIERKFLVINDDWREHVTKQQPMVQAYFAGSDKASIRVRISGESANINIKSATLDVYRKEYEFSIPVQDARELVADLCEQPVIEKTRYCVPYADHVWEVDVFSGANDGLIVAEIELQDANEPFAKPSWIGKEVSDDKRYYNVCLVKHPYKDW